MFRAFAGYIRNRRQTPKSLPPVTPAELAGVYEEVRSTMRHTHSVRREAALDMAGLILKVLARRPDLAQAVLQELPSVIPDPERWPETKPTARNTTPRLMVLIRERPWEYRNWANVLAVAPGVDDPEAALRAAVREFLDTPDGRKAAERACMDFNWGDALNDVPDEYLRRHGLRLLEDTEAVVVTVNQDEVLCRHLEDEEEEEA